MIGIVSKPSHCKTHLKALRELGLEATCLGGGKHVRIPPSVEVLILRTASCSHRASDEAFAWVRSKTNTGHLIVQNGLSAIKRELAQAGFLAEVQTVSEPEPKALSTTTLEAEMNDLPTIPTIPTSDSQSAQNLSEEGWDSENLPVNLWSEPPSENWAKVHTSERLQTAYTEAQALLEDPKKAAASGALLGFYFDLENSYRQKIGRLYDVRCSGASGNGKRLTSEFQKSLHGEVLVETFGIIGDSCFWSNPRLFAVYMYSLFPEGHEAHKKAFCDFYKCLTGSGMDTRLPNAAAWLFGYPEPSSASSILASLPPNLKIEIPEKSETSSEKVVSQDAVDSNTEAILTLMDDLSTFKNEIRADVAQVSAGLESLEMAESARLTGDDVSLMAGMEARKVVEAMGEELRADISNAFDALAAEAQAASNPASNPLAALEQVKAALKAAGFTGTLTLTIE